VGPDNDQHITEATRDAALVVVAWGAQGRVQGRDRQVLALLRQAGVTPHALRLLRGGEPEHPLYLPSELKPFPFEVSRA
jgi:hypothetical protein